MSLSPLSSCHQRTELSTGLLGQIQDFSVGVGGAVGLHGVSQLLLFIDFTHFFLM